MIGQKVLLVEDSATQMEAALSVLTALGFEVTSARTGEEAMEAVKACHFDLVLSDVVMPGMSGFELCSWIKQETDDPPPVVLLTSLSDPRDIVRGVECGADSYLTKPYLPERLAARAVHAIRNRRLASGTDADGPVAIDFLGETYTIKSNTRQILGLLLSSFEELIETNSALQESKRMLGEMHSRELKGEQEARERAEEGARRMEALMQRAEAASRARDDMLAMVSHDLRNPVGTIFTSAALLLEMDLPPEGQKKQLEIIRRTAERMDRLIQDLLDVSRMEAGHFSVQTRPESARSLALEAREMLAGVAASHGIDIVSELAQPDVEVNADRDRVIQVFSNLLGNALKFTPAGGRITIRSQRDGDNLLYSVSDTGRGIAPEELQQIFDRFWHGREGGGAGLGLAISQGIIEAHRGRIWAESDGHGSTFLFTLRIAEASDQPV